MDHRTNKKFLSQDSAISAVVGTILMIAVTVLLGATVYAAINGFGEKETETGTDAVFKVQGIDTDGDGRGDTIKVTYLTGPGDVAEADVTVNIVDPAGTETDLSVGHGAWDPGDFETLASTGPGAYFVTVSILGNTVVDTNVNLDE